jgi:hypothetical protein
MLVRKVCRGSLLWLNNVDLVQSCLRDRSSFFWVEVNKLVSHEEQSIRIAELHETPDLDEQGLFVVRIAFEDAMKIAELVEKCRDF